MRAPSLFLSLALSATSNSLSLSVPRINGGILKNFGGGSLNSRGGFPKTLPILREKVACQRARVCASVDTNELIKVFGRLGDKEYVLQDIEKTSASGYGFASYTSARPKWILCYDQRNIRSEECPDRLQKAKWVSLFDENGQVEKKEFINKLTGLRFAFPLGPGFVDIRPNDLPSTEVSETAWRAFAGPDASVLTKDRFLDTLKTWSEDGGETVLWEQFQQAMTNRIDN
ncbi:hypothetical protein AAMO2058_000549700 [Amorphochlora amoebiformis]